MITTYNCRHTTVYNYTLPVTVSHHAAHLVPRALPTQIIHGNIIRVTPEPAHRSTRTDYFGNNVFFFTLEETHRSLTVESLCTVTLCEHDFPPADETPPWEKVRDFLASARSPEALVACQYVFDSSFVVTSSAVEAYARPSFPPGRPILTAVVDLMHRIHCEFTYDPKATTLATPLKDVLGHRRGVCQDFAHLQIACCRTMGLAARYVSGYVHTCRTPSPTEADCSTMLIGADASHAWLAVYVPGVGWVDLDPTNDTMPSIEHITIAWGRDYDDVSPLKGVVTGGGQHTPRVEVSVTRRPTP